MHHFNFTSSFVNVFAFFSLLRRSHFTFFGEFGEDTFWKEMRAAVKNKVLVARVESAFLLDVLF